MKRNSNEKSAAQTRRANRGNVPGCLGMEELAMLTGKQVLRYCPTCNRKLLLDQNGCLPQHTSSPESGLC